MASWNDDPWGNRSFARQGWNLTAATRGDRLGTVTRLLRERALAQPTGTAYSFIEQPGQLPVAIANADLEAVARAVAARLQAGHGPGERVLLLLPPGRAFLGGFFGASFAGVVPVPLPPLNRAGASPHGLRGIERVAADCGAAAVITTRAVAPILKPRDGSHPFGGAAVHRIEDLARGGAHQWAEPDVEPSDVAFLQYTSGSTADPRGVLVTHANLAANLGTIQRGFAMGTGDHGVIWLPPHHDMGLIGGLLASLASGFDVTCFPATDFVQSPIRWLRAITDTNGTVSGGPDFAYRLCVERIRDDQLHGVDLSSWRVAFTGAEPVCAATLSAFADRFRPFGFDPAAFYPCYGLAEATLMVTGGVPATGAPVRRFSRRALEQDGRAEPTAEPDDGRRMVSCGRAVDPESEVLIADPVTSAECGPDQVGEIWVRGPSVAAGYAGRPEATASTFQATTADGRQPYLRTGDLGFLADGELYVTGRSKDTIVMQGRTLHAPDVEDAVRATLSVPRAGLTAALSIVDEGPERLVVIQELGQGAATSAARIVGEIQAAIAKGFGVRAHEVVLARVGTIPRTTSGKVRRLEARTRYLSGELRLLVPPAAPGSRESLDASPAGEPALSGKLLDVDRRSPDHQAARVDAEPGTGDAGRPDA